MRTFQVCVAASLAVVFSSCVPSDNPLSDLDRSEPDPELYRTWVHESDDYTEVMVVGRPGRFVEGTTSMHLKDVPAGLMRYAQIQIGPDRLIDQPGAVDFFVTKLGRDRYLNVIMYDQQPWPIVAGNQKAWDKRRIQDYCLAKYQVSGDRLTIWKGDNKAMARAIESGKISGEVDRDGYGHLKESTANLVKYLENGGGAVLFPDSTKMEYFRMRAIRSFKTREWVSNDGKSKVEAELVSFDGKFAKLKKRDGTTIVVSLALLSAADRMFLESNEVGQNQSAPVDAK